MQQLPTFQDIQAAHQRIAPFVHQTPVLSSKAINAIAGKEVFFKCENFQKAGAFKYRGAYNSILQLSPEQKKAGVATHSSGNHAGALAKAAYENGIKAHIVMPNNAPAVKKKAVEEYGASITFCAPTLEARESTLKQIVANTGAKFIHPYDYQHVIAGQGTACLELLTEFPDLDTIIAPVGGGGLLSGTSIAAKAINPSIKVYGAEPENAADAFRSFTRQELEPSVQPNTIADGLLTSLSPRTFFIICKTTDNIFLVSEKEIVAAMRLVWERMKIIIEPSSAVALAAILANKLPDNAKRVGLIVSGGNVDLSALPF